MSQYTNVNNRVSCRGSVINSKQQRQRQYLMPIIGRGIGFPDKIQQ